MSLPTYTISPDGKSITCQKCGRTSHSEYDVAERFCGRCRLFHQDMEVIQTTIKTDTSNRFVVGVRADGQLVVMRPIMGVVRREDAINLAVWLKVMADPQGDEFARVEREVRSS